MKKSETAELNFQLQARTELERNYKDTVFVTVFHEKEKLIELYNAIFDTDYDENTAIDIVTIKDVLFRTLKNDVSFVLDKRFVVLVEHQSTINGNLPLRDLLYMSTVLKRMIDTKQLYREKILRIPRPAFIVLYNGPEDLPEYQELRLSDAYLGDKEEREEDALQLIVKVQFEPLRCHITDACNFAKSDHSAAGHVCHIDVHVIHQCHVVFTITEHADVFHHHRRLGLTGRRGFKCFPEHLCNFMVGIRNARKDLLVHSPRRRHPGRLSLIG